MSGNKVLIVGAGALGLTCGYHLQLAGADITFLVRPHRLESLSRPQRLYCYNDHTAKVFKDYRVIAATEELQGQRYDFVMLTLDGATCRSDQGTATITALGNAVRDYDTTMIICGVGVGLYEHVRNTSGFSASRLLEGTMKMLAYQVDGAKMPLPSPTDIELHNASDIAYISFPNGVAFYVSSAPKQQSTAFAGIWGKSDLIRCKRMPTKLFRVFSNTFFPFTVACELDGWRGTDALIKNEELWQLCCNAQREVMRLKHNGLTGKAFALLMSNSKLEKSMRDLERDASPMGFTAFNKFHHGGKVLEQNIQIMENCANIGEQDGRKMTALNTLLSRWHESRH